MTRHETAAALGEAALVEGYRLVGIRVCAAESEDDVRRMWAALPETTGVVILTPRAASALGAALTDPASPLTVVMPS
jgi:vacuolar-type H+-ATPase subunit F/Vma7